MLDNGSEGELAVWVTRLWVRRHFQASVIRL